MTSDQVLYLLDYFGIDYVEEGDPRIRELNVPWSGNNEIAICCPHCDFDERFFVGIDPEGRHGCFYCGSGGSGKSIPWTVAAAAGVPLSDVFNAMPSKRYNPTTRKEIISVSIPELGKYAKSLDDSAVSRKYVSYLVDRGVPRDLISRYIPYYQIMRGIGDFKNRIIYPVFREGRVRSFVGRSIDGNKVRYRNADTGNGFEKVSNNLLNFDKLMGGRLLIICEGIFDVHLLPFCGVDGTALLGKTISNLQVTMLRKIVRRYDKVVVILDSEVSDLAKMDIVRKLGIPEARLPGGYSDLGEVPFSEIKSWVNTLV